MEEESSRVGFLRSPNHHLDQKIDHWAGQIQGSDDLGRQRLDLGGLHPIAPFGCRSGVVGPCDRNLSW